MSAEIGKVVWVDRADEWPKRPYKDLTLLGSLELVELNFHLPSLTGDDHDDTPAEHNAGFPYGAKHVEIDKGDIVIVIKGMKSD